MRYGMTLLRLTIGVLFMGHGLQKLRGWFGGHGLDATGQAFESMGLRPGKRHATAAALSETLGGALLVTGLLTPVAASVISGTMAVAIQRAHLKNGVWATNSGYEYNLVLIAAMFSLAAAGPGEWSLDRRLGIDLSGPGVAAVSLASGIGGAFAATTVGSEG